MTDNMISNLKSSGNQYTLEKISTTTPIFLNTNLNEFSSETPLFESSPRFDNELDFYNSNTFLINGSDHLYSNSTNLTSIQRQSNDIENDWVNLTVVIIKGIIFSSIIVAAVLGNALVIISVQRNRKLRYFFIALIEVICFMVFKFTEL